MQKGSGASPSASVTFCFAPPGTRNNTLGCVKPYSIAAIRSTTRESPVNHRTADRICLACEPREELGRRNFPFLVQLGRLLPPARPSKVCGVCVGGCVCSCSLDRKSTRL